MPQSGGEDVNIFLIGVIVSIIVYLVVGLYAGHQVKDVNDYYVSGRNAPTLLISGTLFASMLSVNGFMGDQGWCYTGNIIHYKSWFLPVNRILIRYKKILPVASGRYICFGGQTGCSYGQDTNNGR